MKTLETTNLVKAIAVFRGDKKHGVILQEDVANFIKSIFTQPENTSLHLIRVDVDPKQVGAPISKRPERPQEESGRGTDGK